MYYQGMGCIYLFTTQVVKYIDDASTWFDYIEVKYDEFAVEDVIMYLNSECHMCACDKYIY